jgi:hypothetical protein
MGEQNCVRYFVIITIIDITFSLKWLVSPALNLPDKTNKVSHSRRVSNC